MLKKLAIDGHIFQHAVMSTRVTKLPLASLKKPFIVAGGALLLLIVVQLAYPQNRTRPLTKVANSSYGYMTKDQMIGRIEDNDKQAINFKLNKKEYRTTAQEIGLKVDAQQIANAATQYPVSERLVPFSLLRSDNNIQLTRSVNDKQLDGFISKLVQENSSVAVSAKAVMAANGTFVLEPAKSGFNYDAGKLKAAITQTLSTPTKHTIVLNGSELKPRITDDKVAAAIDAHKQLKQKTLNVVFGNTTVNVSPDQVSAWGLITHDEPKGLVEVTYNQAAIEAWLTARSGLVAQPFLPTTIYIVDGVEQKREAGRNGQSLGVQETVAAVVDAIKNNKASAQASVQVVPPSQRTVRSYSSTNSGVLAMIKDWQAEHKTARTAVFFQEIGGQGRSASASPDSSYFAASLYKLYIALYLLDGIDKQTINPADQVIDGKDVSACIQAMIVVSHNGCPETIAARYGWNTIDGFITSKGFPSSVSNGNIRVTAASMGDYLRRLYAGQLLSPSSTQTLLGYMSQQIYRSAIPAGVSGSLVQNKVGFYGGSWHDAGIVYSPKGTYILVVLTEGAGASAIADLSRRINTIL